MTLSDAQQHARATARRERQVAEITALVVAGARARAAGLALEHAAEFPDDTDLLERIGAAGESWTTSDGDRNETRS